MITNTTFDTGRKKYYSELGYFIQDQNGNKYVDMAILDSVIDDYTLTETDEKIIINTSKVMVKLVTPPSKTYEKDYLFTLNSPSTSNDILVNFGDGESLIITHGNNIEHYYYTDEEYYIIFDMNIINNNTFESQEHIAVTVIGEDVTNIGELAFKNCGLSNILFKSSTPPVSGDNCFLNCTATVIVPNGCSEIYTEALKNSGGNLTITEYSEYQ